MFLTPPFVAQSIRCGHTGPYHDFELIAITLGVRKYGREWAAIKRDPEYGPPLRGRSGDQLKNKFRTMRRNSVPLWLRPFYGKCIVHGTTSCCISPDHQVNVSQMMLSSKLLPSLQPTSHATGVTLLPGALPSPAGPGKLFTQVPPARFAPTASIRARR